MAFRLFLAASLCAAVLAQAGSAFAETAPAPVFRDCPQCPEMVAVPAGRFAMGAGPGEEERENVPAQFRGVSQPRVDLAIAVFAIGRFEVTRGEFAAFVAEAGHAVGSGCSYYNYTTQDWEADPKLDWRSPGFAQTDQHPVICISWDDAAAYAVWLARKTGHGYRLPTESEWEYAARAGTTTLRPWGDAADDACDHANVEKVFPSGGNFRRCVDRHRRTAPVGSYKPNRFGLHDMIGNVWEWTEDCWNVTLANLPANGAARTTGDCSRRTTRGGAWNYHVAGRTRSWTRATARAGYRSSDVGFRVARSN